MAAKKKPSLPPDGPSVVRHEGHVYLVDRATCYADPQQREDWLPVESVNQDPLNILLAPLAWDGREVRVQCVDRRPYLNGELYTYRGIQHCVEVTVYSAKEFYRTVYHDIPRPEGAQRWDRGQWERLTKAGRWITCRR